MYEHNDENLVEGIKTRHSQWGQEPEAIRQDHALQSQFLRPIVEHRFHLAVKGYTSTAHTGINQFLRHPQTDGYEDPYEQQHLKVQEVFKDVARPLDHDVHAYAGINHGNMDHIRGLIKPGQRATFRGYSSGSLSTSVPFKFSRPHVIMPANFGTNGEKEIANHHIVHYHYPAGSTQGIHVGGVNPGFLYEREFLGNHGMVGTYTGTTSVPFEEYKWNSHGHIHIHHFKMD